MYPNITDYKNAILYLTNRASTLTNYDYLSHNNEPVFTSGNYAAVFKVINTKTKCCYAIKCFTKFCEDRHKRYQAIASFIKGKKIPYFINFSYLEKELSVTTMSTTDEYPVLKMDWIDGPTFGKVISDACKKKDTDTLNSMIIQWKNLCKTLKKYKISHGDLKHDNIIVTPNKELKLVDYDGMFVPALKGFQAIENGSASYQHPNRDSSWFDDTLDDFSILVISLSLLALKHSPHLYLKYNTSENLIFTSSDFQNINQSALVSELRQIKDKQIQTYIKLIEDTIKNVKINLSHVLENEPYFREISVKYPAYFIVLIDRSNQMQIDQGSGQPLQNINDIIKELVIDIQNLCTKNSKIYEYCYITITYYNSNQQQSGSYQPFSITSNTDEIIANSNHSESFDQAMITISNMLKEWLKTHQKSFPPTIINISSQYKSLNPSLLKQFSFDDQPILYYNICGFYQQYHNTQIVRFPENIDDYPAYSAIYENSSFIPDCTCTFLKENFEIDCHNACKGMLVNATYPLVYKFVHSIFKGPFHQGK